MTDPLYILGCAILAAPVVAALFVAHARRRRRREKLRRAFDRHKNT